MEELYGIYKKHPFVTTDSRGNVSGSIFFCLKGPNFDANDYALEALEQGAAHVVADRKEYHGVEDITVVDDVLIALQNLARKHRDHFSFPVIGITGSNGKTTTKELITAVLRKKYKTTATKGNLNNHIGVPLTLLSIPPDAEMAVIEMGANHQGEIRELSKICDPDVGMITNIGKAHLEGFGGAEGVRKGKKELFDHLIPKGGMLFVNADDDVLQEISDGADRTLYGTNSRAWMSGQLLDTHPTVSLSLAVNGEQTEKIQTQLVGAYNLPNILAAACIGSYYKVPLEEIKEALETYISTNNRSQIIATDKNQVILDAYNANPSSMKVAIENLDRSAGNKKIALLGEMKELGVDSEMEHQALVDLVANSTNIAAIFVGEGYANCKLKDMEHYASAAALKEKLIKTPLQGYTILLKGSRLAAMETLLPVL